MINDFIRLGVIVAPNNMNGTVAISAVVAILVSLIGAMVLGAFPDPQREVVNALPDTNPDIKNTVNTALDVKDQVETMQDNFVITKNIGILFLAIGLPSAVIGGLVLRARS